MNAALEKQLTGTSREKIDVAKHFHLDKEKLFDFLDCSSVRSNFENFKKYLVLFRMSKSGSMELIQKAFI